MEQTPHTESPVSADAGAESGVLNIPSRAGFEGPVSVSLISSAALPRSMLRRMFLSTDVLVEAFLYLIPEAATVGSIHSAIQNTMSAWGNDEVDIPCLPAVGEALFSMITKHPFIHYQPNPVPPHDAIYVMDQVLRDCLDTIILTPFAEVRKQEGAAGIEHLFLPVVVIRAVLFHVTALDANGC